MLTSLTKPSLPSYFVYQMPSLTTPPSKETMAASILSLLSPVVLLASSSFANFASSALVSSSRVGLLVELGLLTFFLILEDVSTMKTTLALGLEAVFLPLPVTLRDRV